MHNAIWLGLFAPLVSFLIIMFLSNKIGRRLSGILGCASIFISFASFLSVLIFYIHHGMEPFEITLFQWIPVDKINAGFTLHIDSLALLMTMIITGIGFLIHVYSIGYMEHDEDIPRYFACMNFFVFAMLLLVLAAHLLLLFVGWEGVGLASYLLIGFYYERPSAAAAATKAFVVNRIGDLGFLLGLLLIFHLFGTGNIVEIGKLAGQNYPVGAPLLVVLTLLLFIGATGKSAQLPLQTWLPDAMEGPTPVSALIHAATMVTAGVYLIVRMHPTFMMAPITLHIVGIIGGLTALYAALCALAQSDLKRVLAYSTISQLGYMFLACGAGAFYAAMFHLMNHAFMKALLFLSAGNVIHMMRGTTDMGKMGGLAKKFPWTHWMFLIGVLAMSGVPPLAAFFSKDLILEAEYIAGFETLFYIGLVTAILTSFYLIRAYILTFWGTSHLQEKVLKAVKEAPKIMLIPVTILGILSVIGGFLGFAVDRIPPLEYFLKEIGITKVEKELTTQFVMTPETWMSVGGALLGIFTAFFMYTRYASRLGKPVEILKRSFYVDEIYDYAVVSPLKAMSKSVNQFFEPKVFEGGVQGLQRVTQGIAKRLQQMQSGQIRSYIAWMVVGTVILVAYLVF